MGKSVLKGITVLIIIVSLFLVNIQYGYSENKNVKPHWADAQIQKWMNYGILKGYTDPAFNPDKAISRAELASLINRVFNYRKKTGIKFSDLTSGNPYYEDIVKAVKAGYLSGYNGKVRPADPITRQETAKVISVAFSLDSKPSNASAQFRDSSSISKWAVDYVGRMVDLGVLKGNNGRINPQKYVTVAEAVSMLDRICGDIYSIRNKTCDGKIVSGNLVINHSGISMKNTVINGNLYLTEGIEGDEMAIDSVTVKGTLYIKGCLLKKVNITKSNMGQIIVTSPESRVNIVLKENTLVKKIAVNTSTELSILEGAQADTVNLNAPSTLAISGISDTKEVVVSKDAEKSEIYSKQGVIVNNGANEILVNGAAVKRGTMVTKAFDFDMIDVY